MTDTRLREAAQAVVDWYDQGVKWHTARHMIDPLRAALAAPAAPLDDRDKRAIRSLEHQLADCQHNLEVALAAAPLDEPWCGTEAFHKARLAVLSAPLVNLDVERLARALHDHERASNWCEPDASECDWMPYYRDRSHAIATAYREDKA